MKIIWKYILNNLKERKLRTLVMLLSIVLSTTLLFVSLAIGDSYESAQQKMAKGLAGEATVTVFALPDEEGNAVWITGGEIPDIPSIQSKAGILKTPALYSEEGVYDNIDILAADLSELNQINKPRLLNGAALADFSGYSIVLPERFTSQYDIVQGDTVDLTIGGESYAFRVAAVAAYDTIFLRSTRGTSALIPVETLSEILHSKGGSSEILIKPAEGVGTDVLVSALLSALPQDRYTVEAVYNEAQVEAAAKEKSMPFYLISFFALTMSIFIIFSSYKVITMERLPAIGTFRSIGATEKAVEKILMLESLTYGVLGGLIGIPAGLVVLKLILNGLGESLSLGIEIPMVVSPLNIVYSCIVAIAVSLLSAYIPVRRASRLPVKDVVLGNVEEKNNLKKSKLCFGIALFIVSIILPQIAGKNDKLLTLAGGISLVGLITATIVLIPLFVDGICLGLERVYGAFWGNVGRLAARNMRHNKNSNQNITLLFISLSAVIAISVVGSFASTYIGDVFNGAALDGFADANMSAEFVQEVKDIEGTREVLPIFEIERSVSGGNAVFERLEAVDDLHSLDAMLNIKYDNENTQKNMEAEFGSARNILLSRDCLKQRGAAVGDAIELQYNGRAYEYTIIGVFQSRADNSEAIIPAVYAKSDFGAEYYGMLAYTADDPVAVMSQIRNLFGNKENWSRTKQEFNEDAMGTINSFLEPMHKLTYFILLLAAIGVINNLIINFIQKRRAIAMYKSLGMSNRQNCKMAVIEGLTSGLIGAVIGVLVSYFEIQTIFIVTGPRVSIKPEIDAGVFLAAGLAGVVINLAGSVVPIFKGLKMKVVEEIKFE